MAGNNLNRGLIPEKSVPAKRRRRPKANTSVFLAVLIVIIILVLVGVYIFFNDVKMPVALSIADGCLQ